VSLAADTRGRVPFALVGVLLLLGASVYATGVADRTEPSIDRPATAAMDDVVSDARPALGDAIRAAAREAARQPVTEPADTPAGRALDDSQPYVDALRLRIALAARESLAGLSREHGPVEARVDLPPVDGSTVSLRRAKSAISVAPVDGGAALRVTVRNLSVRAVEGGETVAQRRHDLTLTVETPVLSLHQRTREYERRLNRGALAGPGLARGLTTRLTAIAMARGNGRYAGAPIRNVLANRHVELSTNAALLAQQRAVFGRHDPAGARAVDVATVEVGVLDVLGGRHGDAAAATDALLAPNAVEGATSEPASGAFDPRRPATEPITADPGAAADRAYLDAVDDTSTAGSYRVRSRLRVVVLTRTSAMAPRPRLDNWTLVDREHSERTVVTTVGNSTRAAADPVVDTVRKVTIHHTVERRWRRDGRTRTTTAEWTETARVAVRVTAAYAPTDAAPDRPTAPLFERGGALAGPNLAGARERAAEALLAANGGVDGVAVSAVADHGDVVVHERTITAARPSALDAWIAADLRGLRAEVANVTVSVPRSAVASGDANAPAMLAETLRERRRELLDAPATYDGAADRARVAARAAYLDRVLAELDARAAETRGRNLDYRDELGDRTTAGLSKLVELGRGGDSPYRGIEGDRQSVAVGDDLVLTPDGGPAYLTLEPVEHDQAPSVPPGETVHPLTARTTNWVAVPYGDAADGVVDALLGGGTRTVSLERAAATLIAANRTAGVDDPDRRSTQLATERAELAAAVGESVRRAERAVCDAATNGTGLRRSTCRAAVVDARDRWPTLGRRGRAMTNGSYAAAFEGSLTARGADAATADEAAVRVGLRLRQLSREEATRVPAATTNETASIVQQAAWETARKQLSGALENASARATRRLTGASRLPAGLPVAPAPYTWIATVNGWSVTVRGEYQRFAVRARAPAPDGAGSTIRYVRDGSAVRLDVDGDGERERLGRSERVSFEASTTVVAVVPPGMPGVGDVDGNRDERSPGWPCPGADDERCTADEPE